MLILSLLLINHEAGAQVQITGATRQRWSGGIAGHMGSNYSINITWTVSKMPLLDSVYADNQALIMRQRQFQFHKTGSHTGTVTFGTSRDDAGYLSGGGQADQTRRSTADGSVILVFNTGRKKRLINTKAFTELPSANYP